MAPHDEPLNGNGWSKYEKLVLFRLDEQDRKAQLLAETVKKNFDTLTSKVDVLTTAVTVLKTKAGLFGTLGGLIGAWAVEYFRH